LAKRGSAIFSCFLYSGELYSVFFAPNVSQKTIYKRKRNTINSLLELSVMKTNFKIKLYDLLKKDSRLWDEEKKELNETLLKDLIDKFDEKLIESLLSDKETKEKFFINIKGVFDLKQNEMKLFIDENKLDNSYTQYQNKIGLRIGNKLLSERDEVVLDWPFKDCVLEGGMTKEDQKRNEIFFNEILAKDEIDRLFDEKALINWKRYGKGGEQEVKEIKRNDNGIIKENLIIKGNNLLALYTLKKQFAGKIKLIYIDPPYNTGNDGFKYNDNFKHSTWLTFMKNRLEIARNLLRDDGVIFVQCDDHEQAYLKILMDEIFGRENFVSNIVYKRRQSQANLSKNISPIHDLIVIFSKSKNINLNRISTGIDESKYSNPDNDPRGFYVTMPCTNKGGAKYKITTPTGKIIEDEWRFKKETYLKLEKENKLVFPNSGNGKPRYKLFLNDKKEQGNIPNTWWDDVSSNQEANREIKEIFGETIFSFPKPEALIQRIIEISTDKNDIILDYHLGSGTTCAVAHKMEKQYIGIEQMDYIETIAVKRLKKVINGEQGGISKSVNWQGGGEFVYLELAKWNEEAKEKILMAKSLSELERLFDELYERYFLNYNVKTKEFKEKILKEKGFKNLSLDEQKNLFVEMLDVNQMYVNFSEREDKKYNLAKEDIILSEKFYNYGK